MLNGVLPFFGETTKIKKQEEAQKADAKKLAETTQVEAKKALSAFGNLSTQRANVDEVELTSSKKAEEISDEKENPNNCIHHSSLINCFSFPMTGLLHSQLYCLLQ